MAYVDLAELESGALERWPFFSSRTPWALTSLLASDHLSGGADGDGRQTEPLGKRLRDAVEAECGRRPEGPVRLLAGLRILGMEFNPVSFFYVLKPAGEELAEENDGIGTQRIGGGRQVETFVAEVNNIPWFEQHLYILSPKEPSISAEKPCGSTPVEGEDTAERSAASSSLETVQSETNNPSLSRPTGNPAQLQFHPFEGHAKAFHVSPFMPIANIAYDWLVTDPGERIGVRIALSDSGERIFSASIDMRRRPFQAQTLAALLLTFPLMAVKVVLAIMFEAGKLWLRGFAFYPHPAGKETASSRAIEKIVAAFVSVQHLVYRLRGKVSTE